MINVIFTFIPTIPLTEEQTRAFQQEAVWVPVPECKDGTFQAYVHTVADMETIRYILGTLGTVNLIGVWNTDGTQYGFERQTDAEGVETIVQVETPLTYPLNTQAYLDALLDEVTYDENGNELTRTRPVELKHVNKFAGMADRILN